MHFKAVLLLVLTFITPMAFPYELVGTVVGITDGDTLKLLVDNQQYKIRLSEIDTPEKGQPWGKKAKQALSEKVFRKEVRIEVVDTDRYGRLVGKIWQDGKDINRGLVAKGHAWVYRQYMTDRSLLEDEESARSNRLGLWSLDNPIPPWDWRRGGRTVVKPGIRNPDCGSKRYCREMSSCEEAMFYLSECGLFRLDGDSDGVPCESICRR